MNPTKINNNVKESNRQWNRVTARFRSEYGEAAFQKWLAHSHVNQRNNNTITLNLHNKNACEHVNNTYHKQLLKLWQQEDNSIKKIQFINQNNPQKIAKNNPQNNKNSNQNNNQINNEHTGQQLCKNKTFSKFAVGANNELAFRASKTIAQGENKYSPLYIYGNNGVGKTHLLQATAHHTKDKFLFLPADALTKIFVRSINQKGDNQFENMFININILLIDDIHFIAGKKATQEALIHIISKLTDNQCKIIAAGDRPLREIENINPSLISRLSNGITAEIQNMDTETKLALIQQKTKDWNIQIPNDVLNYVAENINGNGRELEGCLRQLTAQAELLNIPITRETMQPVLQKLNPNQNNTNISIRLIQEKTCQQFNVTRTDLTSARRHKAIVLPRHVAMYLCKKLTTRSLPEIAAKFGGRDHTTIIHACNKIDKLTQQQPQLLNAIDKICKNIKTQ